MAMRLVASYGGRDYAGQATIAVGPRSCAPDRGDNADGCGGVTCGFRGAASRWRTRAGRERPPVPRFVRFFCSQASNVPTLRP